MPVNPSSILIVEADPVQRDIITLALRRSGYTSLAYCDGGEVRQRVEADSPALLLLDIHLPGQSGLDLLNDLKSAGLLKKTTVMVISSMGFSEVVHLAVDVGAKDFLVKPLDVELMLQRVAKALGT